MLGLRKISMKKKKIGPKFALSKDVSRPPLSIGIVDVLAIW